MHISTGTETSIFDEETKTCIFSENVISVALSGYKCVRVDQRTDYQMI
jgi:hypothetical protein